MADSTNDTAKSAEEAYAAAAAEAKPAKQVEPAMIPAEVPAPVVSKVAEAKQPAARRQGSGRSGADRES